MHTAHVVGDYLDYRLSNKGQTMFITAQPGSGKTTGVLLWIVKQIVERTEVRVLLGVPTVALMEQVRKDLFELYEQQADGWSDPADHIGWWSLMHDINKKDDTGIDRTEGLEIPEDCYVHRMKAETRQVVILTHAAIKQLGRESKDRINPDVVIMDENPAPDMTQELDIEHIARMLKACDPHEEEMCSILNEAARWMMENTAKKFEVIEHAKWIHRYLAIYEPSSNLTGSADHKRMAWVCSRIDKGWGFTEYAGERKTLIAYDYHLPFADRAVIVSATGELEGAQFADQSTVDFRDKNRFTPVDYSDVTIIHITVPKQLVIRRAMQAPKPDTIWDYADLIETLEQDASERGFNVPFYCTTKQAELMFKGMEIARGQQWGTWYDKRKDQFSYWGKDVGVNKFQDCDVAIMFGLHMYPQRAAIAHKRAHKQLPMDQQFLNGHTNVQNRDMRQIQDDIAARHMYQMASRTCVRQVIDGKAKPAVIYMVNNDSRRTQAIARVWFPGAKVVERAYVKKDELAESGEKVVRKRYYRQKPVDKAARGLRKADADIVYLNDKAFTDADIRFNPKAIQALVNDNAILESTLGFSFVRGRRGGERHHFTRIR